MSGGDGTGGGGEGLGEWECECGGGGVGGGTGTGQCLFFSGVRSSLSCCALGALRHVFDEQCPLTCLLPSLQISQIPQGHPNLSQAKEQIRNLERDVEDLKSLAKEMNISIAAADS